MSDFWGFEGAHLLAIAMIVFLGCVCLYLARHWGKKL